jgi:hypothetical protein
LTGDSSLAGAGAEELPDLLRIQRGCGRAAETLAGLAGMSQSSADALAQDL